MIELMFLVVALGAFFDKTKRRGVRAWPFVTVALLGWFCLGVVTQTLAASVPVPGPGPLPPGELEPNPIYSLIQGSTIILPWLWVGLVYASIPWIAGGGKRFRETWHCPECRLFNSPSTLVCPCGFEPTAKRPDAMPVEA